MEGDQAWGGGLINDSTCWDMGVSTVTSQDRQGMGNSYCIYCTGATNIAHHTILACGRWHPNRRTLVLEIIASGDHSLFVEWTPITRWTFNYSYFEGEKGWYWAALITRIYIIYLISATYQHTNYYNVLRTSRRSFGNMSSFNTIKNNKLCSQS